MQTKEKSAIYLPCPNSPGKSFVGTSERQAAFQPDSDPGKWPDAVPASQRSTGHASIKSRHLSHGLMVPARRIVGIVPSERNSLVLAGHLAEGERSRWDFAWRFGSDSHPTARHRIPPRTIRTARMIGAARIIRAAAIRERGPCDTESRSPRWKDNAVARIAACESPGCFPVRGGWLGTSNFGAESGGTLGEVMTIAEEARGGP